MHTAIRLLQHIGKSSKTRRAVPVLAAAGEPVVSSFSSADIERLLARNGFRAERLLSPDDIQREVLQGKDVEAFAHIWYAKAVRTYSLLYLGCSQAPVDKTRASSLRPAFTKTRSFLNLLS